MRSLVIAIAIVTVCCSFVFRQASLEVRIAGARNNKGHVLLSVFNKAEGFPDQQSKAYRNYRLEISNQTASVTITGLPVGEYAFAVLHDENDDAKMNTNWIGIPKEGFGFSNNVMGLFGPPSFHKAKIVHNGSAARTEIRLKYM